jgi:uncharacterized protein YdhG (YjbR/CyaY superfamily)
MYEACGVVTGDSHCPIAAVTAAKPNPSLNWTRNGRRQLAPTLGVTQNAPAHTQNRMPKSPTFRSHDEYIAVARPEVQPLLRQIESTVQALLPEATPCISYNMPAFKLGRTFFYFAAFKQHIGVYPPVRADTTLLDELAPYLGEKGNLSFSLAKPLPLELIGRVAVALSRQCAAP